MSMFEQSSRKQLRFPSKAGDITVEQLWHLPLTSKTGLDLDAVARTTNIELKAVTEDSFVAVTPNPAKAMLTLKLDVLKHIIATVQAEQKASTEAVLRKQQKENLLGILADKKVDALKGLSVAELEAQIAALG